MVDAAAFELVNPSDLRPGDLVVIDGLEREVREVRQSEVKSRLEIRLRDHESLNVPRGHLLKRAGVRYYGSP